MATSWGTLKAQIRRLLVDTDDTQFSYTDDQLLDYIAWTLDALSAHTALATATSFACDGNTTVFNVPSNVYEPVWKTGDIFVDDGLTVSYLNLVRASQRNNAVFGYYELPDNVINTVMTPSSVSTLTIQYFAYYPHPAGDSDLILTPSWALPALSYKVASHCFASAAGKSASIRQWGAKPDTGKPTDNVIADMADKYNQLWERELQAAPRQERENYFRTDLIGGIPKR